MLLNENFCETCMPKLSIKDVYDIDRRSSLYQVDGVLGQIVEFIMNYSMPTELLHCTYVPAAIANDIEMNFGVLSSNPITCEYNPFITDHYAPEIIHFDLHIGHYPYTIRLIPKDEFA